METTSTALHVMAMAFMLCDHVWALLLSGYDWMTCIGRLAFPIFAFMLVEGYFHTKNLKKYALRMLLFALLSELPFDLAVGGTLFYPLHQNVLWSFLLSLGLLHWNEKAKATGKLWLRAAVGCGTALLGCVLGLVTMVDYHHAGVLTVLVFYFCRGSSLWARLGQLLGLWYINFELLGGLVYEFSLFGTALAFPRQGFAVLALLPIWLYRGRQGYHSKWLRRLYYGFYPAHLLLLCLIRAL